MAKPYWILKAVIVTASVAIAFAAASVVVYAIMLLTGADLSVAVVIYTALIAAVLVFFSGARKVGG